MGELQSLSPRLWGWSAHYLVNLPEDLRCPHVCGGGPAADTLSTSVVELSPRLWGWSELPLPVDFGVNYVVPTSVGVVRDRKPRN